MIDLSKFDQKYVEVTDIWGDTYVGVADFWCAEFCGCEFGKEEDAIKIEDLLLYVSQIRSIAETTPHGTAEIWTERLILRKYREDDAEQLYKYIGTDPDVEKYSGWNPYKTPEDAKKTVEEYIRRYREDEHFYAWIMDSEDVVYGIIGAYDYKDGEIEVGFTVVYDVRGRGYATEALKAVLKHLTENEEISCVTAWCAADNTGSRKAMENAGMKLVRMKKNGLEAGGRLYDKLTYKYHRKNG